MLFDNSGAAPSVVAFGNHGKPRIIRRDVYESLTIQYGTR
jgi:hypothetical protein